MTRHSRPGVPGFTLLELLVALTVGGVVVLAVGAAVGLAVDVAGRGRDAAQDRLRAEAVTGAIRGWLEGIRLSAEGGGPGFEGKDGRGLGPARDELAFPTVQTEPLGISAAAGEPTPMRLRVAASDSGLVVDYRRPGAAGDVLAREPCVVSLLPGVRGLSIRYLIRLGDEARWFDAWSSRVRLPAAIEVRLLSEDDEGRYMEWAPLLIALPEQG